MTETDEPPPDEPAKPKRPSFREANLGPPHEPEPPAQPHAFFSKRKRTVAIGLIAMGAGAAAIYGLAHSNNCSQYPPDQAASCRSGGSGGGAHSFGGSGSSGSSSDSSSASRGGFGSTGSAHGSGGE